MTTPDPLAQLRQENERLREAWQPIATAPKDVAILVGRSVPSGWACSCAQWDHEDEWWRVGKEAYFRKPTHWHPLPEPPHD